ncbi:hypothetical protein [Dyella sp.]|uniref:hypothetical protein n=1 Tax=Dyella sp. TaxID=1869338 RepID=UPI002B4A4CA5|nr:hypothetical protein [Dyella sp.]HKT27953.1 hypothetical protein [Dyella sp.]
MKRLACLCALFFAGHVMAQTTCSNATLSGNYIASSKNGTLAAGVNIFVEALVASNGAGTINANFSYTESGGLLNGTTAETIAYTVNSDCSLTANAILAGIPVTVRGHVSPDGNKVVLIAYGPGIALNGTGDKVP